MRLKLTIEYDGTGFRGWARQPGERTVEGELRRALAQLYAASTRSPSRAAPTRACTRSGTSSRSTSRRGPPPERAAEALNAAAAARRLRVVAAEQRAGRVRRALRRARRAPTATASGGGACRRRSRRGARSGIRGRSTCDACRRTRLRSPGEHDFRAFTPSETQHRRFTRTVDEARWVELGEDVVAFEITADSFLRHMVRTLVGSMLEGVELAPLLVGRPAQRGAARPHRRTAST